MSSVGTKLKSWCDMGMSCGDIKVQSGDINKSISQSRFPLNHKSCHTHHLPQNKSNDLDRQTLPTTARISPWWQFWM